jgi:hypothetical protein
MENQKSPIEFNKLKDKANEYYTEGKYKGMPTKQHIILIMIIFDWLIHQIKRYIIID